MQHRMRQPSHLRNKCQSALLLACKEHTGDLQNPSGNNTFSTGPLLILSDQQTLAMKKCFSHTSTYFGPEHNCCWIIDSCCWRAGEQTSQDQVVPSLLQVDCTKELKCSKWSKQRLRGDWCSNSNLSKKKEKFINVNWPLVKKYLIALTGRLTTLCTQCVRLVIVRNCI